MRGREAVMSELKSAVKTERESTLRVIHLLREIERDRHYLSMAYPSLYEFATHELGYSAAAAHRRIQSMRLLKDQPELEKPLEEGTLSLCVAAKTQSFIYRESIRRKETALPSMSIEERREVVQSVLGTSTREAEKKLIARSPESALPRDRTRVITSEKVLVQFVTEDQVVQKLEDLKGAYAHQTSTEGYGGVIALITDRAHTEWRKKTERPADRIEVRPNSRELASDVSGMDPSRSEPEHREQPDREASPGASNVMGATTSTSRGGRLPRTRHIPSVIKNEIWWRDGGRCTYEDEKTGHQCGSKFAIQIDHITPYSWGGQHTPSNLRLVCGRHNRYAAEKLRKVVPHFW